MKPSFLSAREGLLSKRVKVSVITFQQALILVTYLTNPAADVRKYE